MSSAIIYAMQGLVNHKVTCKKCKQTTVVGIVHEQNLVWSKSGNVISGRKRLDGEWGWQCYCGNNSLLTKQERSYISDLQTPDPKDIQAVIDNLVVEKDTNFFLEKA